MIINNNYICYIHTYIIGMYIRMYMSGVYMEFDVSGRGGTVHDTWYT